MITDYNTMKDEVSFPNIHNIDKLLEYLPYFDNKENNFFELINKPP